MMWKYVLAWIPMVFIAIANGALREVWYKKHCSELRAHQLSTVSGILLLGIYMWVIIRVWQPTSAKHALSIGLMWLTLTVAFEFLFGYYVRGLPLNSLLHDYNLLAGRVWILVLVWVTLAPYLFFLW
ncbi:hypothetical protein THII_1462 [Thioploca ingrica]|uniref:Uncharacterized protein n=1 Tax=Thioploca ingrica TaxID=40754 RepID=A0A090AFC0_9GAMM|nr:hypothetical protein THII_1462 [Thioploca ingrica]